MTLLRNEIDKIRKGDEILEKMREDKGIAWATCEQYHL